MRIAVFIKSTTFHKGFGGLETQNKILCEGLALRKHEVTVFSPQRELSISRAKENDVLYEFVKCKYRLGLFSSYDKDNWANRSYEEFLRIHREQPFDIAVSQSSAGLGAIRHKLDIGINVLSVSHGTIIGEYKSVVYKINSWKSLIKWLVDVVFVLRNFFGRQREFIYGSDKIIAVSSVVKKALIEETFVSDDFITVIHNGVDQKAFDSVLKVSSSSESELKKVVNLIYIGRVIKIKGLFLLAEALANLQELKPHLDIVGDGEDLSSLKKYCLEHGIEKQVTFYGKLSYGDVVAKLFNCDIFVLPSLRIEGFPMTIVEAMFAGLPVIASDIGGISDAVVNESTGYLVKAGDVKDLQRKISLLANDSKLRKEFGDNAKIKAQKEFTVDIMIDKYEKVFREFVK